jgi:hypothetical protein
MHRSDSISSVSSSASDAEETMQVFIKTVSGDSSTSHLRLICPAAHVLTNHYSNPPYHPFHNLHLNSTLPPRPPHKPVHPLGPAPRARRQAPRITQLDTHILQHPAQRHNTHGPAHARRHAAQEDPVLVQSVQRRGATYRWRLRLLQRTLLRQAPVVGGSQVRGLGGL